MIATELEAVPVELYRCMITHLAEELKFSLILQPGWAMVWLHVMWSVFSVEMLQSCTCRRAEPDLNF